MKRDHAIRSMNSPGVDNQVLLNGMDEISEYRVLTTYLKEVHGKQ